MRVVPAANATASANTGTGRLRKTIACVVVFGNGGSHDRNVAEAQRAIEKPIRLPMTRPPQVNTKPDQKPSLAPRNVPRMLEGIGRKISSASKPLPDNPNNRALSSTVLSQVSPGSSPIMTKGRIGTSMAVAKTTSWRMMFRRVMIRRYSISQRRQCVKPGPHPTEEYPCRQNTWMRRRR